MRIFSTRLVKFEIAHFLCRGVFLKALSENRLNYVQDSGINPVIALIVVYSGILISDFFLYFVGKKYGRAIIEQKRFRKFLTSEKISALEDKFRKRGIIVILLGRHLVVLRAQIFLVAGIMRMSALKFFIADAVTSIFTIALMVGAGYMGGYSLQVVKRYITKIEHMVVLLLIILVVIYLLFRYFKSR